MELVMHKEIMRENDVLNSDNVGSAMLNLSDVMEDMSGLIYALKPFIVNDTEHELLPHIVRSLETFKSDIDAVHNYLDRICLNNANHSETGISKEGRC
jgi:hypothetical protein